MAVKLAQYDSRSQVKAVFDEFDVNKNTYLGLDEFINFLSSLGNRMQPSDCRQLFDEFDKNADGKISMEEFVDLLFAQPDSDGTDACSSSSSRTDRFFEAIEPGTVTQCSSSNYKLFTRSASPLPKEVEQEISGYEELAEDMDGAVIASYTGNSFYGLVNRALRLDNGKVLRTYGGYVFALKNAMKAKSKGKGWFKGKVYRGMRLPPETLAVYNQMDPGMKFLWAGFVSTSRERDAAFGGNIFFEIDCSRDPGITYALDVEEWSFYSNEKEVLFYPYSGFEVVRKYSAGGRLILCVNAHDRELIDWKDAEEKMSKILTMKKIAKSFVLHEGMLVVVGNKKHTCGSTALRHRADNAGGSNFNGCQLPDGSQVSINELANENEWALVQNDSSLGWIKARNLHVQLVDVGEISAASLSGFFKLSSGRQAVVGNTRHASSVTALRHEPLQKKGDNFNGVVVPDGRVVDILDVTPDCEWAHVTETGKSDAGWIKTRNLHIQLV